MRRLFILRKDILKDHPGNAMAMACHCAESYWTNWLREHTDVNGHVDGFVDVDIFNEYISGIFTKTICQAKNLNHLKKAEVIAEKLGLVKGKDYFIIADNCLTVFTPEYYDENGEGRIVVGIAFRPLPDEIAHQISKKYHLYV